MKDKPLPKPSSPAFGTRRQEEGREQAELLSDRMAAAIAEGRLEEFLKEELPDSEQARTLAMMMMGMTGMLPAGPSPAGKGTEQEPGASAPPENVLEAAQSGDVQALMGLLRQEQEKRSSGKEPENLRPGTHPAAETPGELPAEEKESLDKLIEIAKANNVTVDWIVLRALKLYIREYQKTGRL
jgi:hypothetical protein